MPSFDIVSEVNMQEADNAVNNLLKEISTRYDFKGSNTEIELNKKDSQVVIVATDDMKMRAIKEMFIICMFKRGVDIKALDFGEIEKAGGNKLRQVVKLKNGIDKEHAKEINVMIKESKLKVQSAIMDDKIRITGKKIDDLQDVIQLLKSSELKVPVQFINMKS